MVKKSLQEKLLLAVSKVLTNSKAELTKKVEKVIDKSIKKIVKKIEKEIKSVIKNKKADV